MLRDRLAFVNSDGVLLAMAFSEPETCGFRRHPKQYIISKIYSKPKLIRKRVTTSPDLGIFCKIIWQGQSHNSKLNLSLAGNSRLEGWVLSFFRT